MPKAAAIFTSHSSSGVPQGGYDSLDRLRQYQRGTLDGTGGFAGNGGGSIATPVTLSGADKQRTYDLDSLGNWRRTSFTPEGETDPTLEVRQHNGLNEIASDQDRIERQDALQLRRRAGASNGNLANDGTRSYDWER